MGNRYLRKGTVLILMLLLMLNKVSIVNANTRTNIEFPDLIDNYSKEAIRWGVESNIVSGYTDGTFQPRGNVTEGEWLAMMLKYYNKGESLPKAEKGQHWAQGIYKQVEKYKLPVKGINNIKARSIPSTRKELAQIVAAAHGFNLTYPQAVEFMYENNFSSGNNPNKKNYNTYGPEDNLQRQQAVIFLMKIHNQVQERGGVIYRGEFYKLESGKIIGISNGGIKVIGEPDWSRFSSNQSPKEDEKTTKDEIHFDPDKHIDAYGLIERNKALEYENLFLDSIIIQGNKLRGKLPVAPNGFVYSVGIWVDYKDGTMEHLASTDPGDANRIMEGEEFTNTMKKDLSQIENTFIKASIRNEKTDGTSGWSILDYVTGTRLVKP